MSIVEKKKFIIETLLIIKTNENSTEYYKYIIDLVKSKNINITKNKRGYYFNLNSLDDSTVEVIYDYLTDKRKLYKQIESPLPLEIINEIEESSKTEESNKKGKNIEKFFI